MLHNLGRQPALRNGISSGLRQPVFPTQSPLRRAFLTIPSSPQRKQPSYYSPSPSLAPLIRRSAINTYENFTQRRLQIRFASNTKRTLPPEKDVSTTSTTRTVLKELGEAGPSQVLGPERDIDMTKAIKGDIKAIRETFALSSVPREAYVLGLAGTLPYFGTSLATLFCAWDLNHASVHGASYILSEQSAFELLNYLEPIQVGYGAVILSFLGAIHWGLEWAGYGGYHSYRRYAIGVLAPAVAWPTLLLPYEWALATQFLAFTMLYFVDSTVTTRGWTPPWYSTYRFVLTFLVGASIVVSLIGRGEIGDRDSRKKLPTAVERIKGEDRGDSKRAKYEEEYAKVMDKKAEEQKEQQEQEQKEKEEQEKKEGSDDEGKEEDSDEDKENDKDEDKDENSEGNDKSK